MAKVPLGSRQSRGYGRDHEVRREYLLAQLRDGDLCEVCGEPMFRDAVKNFDGASLEADHEEGDKSRLANRLLHRRCNRSIASLWVKHGEGWLRKFGVVPPHLAGGTFTQW